MVEIPFGDYMGFLGREVARARDMLNAYSRSVAEGNAADPIMRHFPAARFRFPTVELSFPVVVSAVRYSSAMRFVYPARDFTAMMAARVESVRAALYGARGGDLRPMLDNELSDIDSAVESMYADLTSNVDASRSQDIVYGHCETILRACLAEFQGRNVEANQQLTSDQVQQLNKMSEDVLTLVQRHTVVDGATIENLLVNPETNALSENADASTLFRVKIELSEEGVILRALQRDGSEDKFAVDFD